MPEACSYADEHISNDQDFLLTVFSNVGQSSQKHGLPSRMLKLIGVREGILLGGRGGKMLP